MLLEKKEHTQPCITLAMTGASGMPYAMRLLECLVQARVELFLLISKAAYAVACIETRMQLPEKKLECLAYLQHQFGADPGQIHIVDSTEWTSPVASGSSAPRKMVVCPTSMGTLAAIASGSSDNVIERAADVVIKERGQLIVVPREMPYSVIHLEHMLKLARIGVMVMPASPGFYQRNMTLEILIDCVVDRILQHLELPYRLLPPWGEEKK